MNYFPSQTVHHAVTIKTNTTIYLLNQVLSPICDPVIAVNLMVHV